MEKLKITIIRQQTHDISLDQLENYLTRELKKEPILPFSIEVQYRSGEDKFPLDKALDKKIIDIMGKQGYSKADSGSGFGQRDLEFLPKKGGAP